jgi:hypothetical protein
LRHEAAVIEPPADWGGALSEESGGIPLFSDELETGIGQLCRRAADLCRAIAPADLTPGRPVYIVAQSEISGPLRQNTTLGFTAPFLHERLREYVRHCGAGPAMVVNDLKIESEFRRAEAHLRRAASGWQNPGYAFVDLARRFVESAFFGTVVHEMAHALPFAFDASPVDLASVPSEAEAAEFLNRPKGRDGKSPHFDLHGPDFTRLALHFRERAQRWFRGSVEIPIGYCGAGNFYGLAPIEVYEACLGEEVLAPLDSSAAEILNRAMPVAFLRLYGFEIERKKGAGK